MSNVLYNLFVKPIEIFAISVVALLLFWHERPTWLKQAGDHQTGDPDLIYVSIFSNQNRD